MTVSTFPRKDTVYRNDGQEGEALRELIEEQMGLELTGRGAERKCLCWEHDDHHPSMSVNVEKGVYHCQACGASGNYWTLAKKLGLVAQKKMLPGGASQGTGNNYFRAVDPRWSVVGGLRTAGHDARADAIERCALEYRTTKCDACGRWPATIFHCHDTLCPTCRAMKALRFVRLHAAKLPEGMLASLLEVGAFFSRDAVGGDLAVAFQEMRSRVNLVLDVVKARGAVYALRYTEEVGSFYVKAQVLLDGDDKDGLIAAFAFTQAGFVPGQANDYGLEAAGLLEKLGRWMAKPLPAFESAEELLAFDAALKGKRLMQGRGSLYKVSGGKLRGRGDKPEPKACPFCGAGLRGPWRRCRAGDVEEEDGKLFWRSPWMREHQVYSTA